MMELYAVMGGDELRGLEARCYGARPGTLENTIYRLVKEIQGSRVYAAEVERQRIEAVKSLSICSQTLVLIQELQEARTALNSMVVH